MKLRCFGFFIAVCAVVLSGCLQKRLGYSEITPAHGVKVLTLSNDDQANSKNNYVSVAPLADQKFVIANYVSLLLLDRKSGAMCKLAVEGSASDEGDSASQAVTYNPTGVFADSGGRVYVANYKANNILVGTIDSAMCKFKPQKQYRSGNTRGPENVVVDERLGLLVSANYDAGTVTAFDLASKKERWSASIPQAHGVAISDGKVFATGLTERKVYELDISSGNVLRSKGELGWNPMAGQYMWPTTIFPLGDGNLVVADPQSGFVSILDSNTLSVVRYTGGNGPAATLFNYPYTAVPAGKELIVLSSMRGEIFFLNPDDVKVMEKLSFAKEHWPKSEPLPIFGDGWAGYVDTSNVTVRAAGGAYKIGFGNLHSAVDGRVFRIPDSGSVFNPGSYIYFLQTYASKDLDLLLSSSSTTLLGLAHREDYPDVLIPRRIMMDSWVSGSDLVTGTGKTISLSQLSGEIKARADSYYSYLDKHGWVDKKSLFTLLGFSSMGLSYEQYSIRVDAAFTSEPGREFKRAYDQCTDEGCDQKALKIAALSYFKEVAGAAYTSLDEYLLVGMLSGTSLSAQGQARVDFDACEGGRYLRGYGLESLKTETLDDYLSAVDLSGSSVCLSVKAREAVKGFDVVWNDQETAPKNIEVYGRAGEEGGQWDLFQKYSNLSIAQAKGYAVSTFRFDNNKGYSRFLIKVLDGGAQNRLIVRRIQPILVGNSG